MAVATTNDLNALKLRLCIRLASKLELLGEICPHDGRAQHDDDDLTDEGRPYFCERRWQHDMQERLQAGESEARCRFELAARCGFDAGG